MKLDRRTSRTPPRPRDDDTNTRHPRVVGRLAPSPTGGLHLGHARTFLIAWWMARKANGRILLRIEDLDSSRVRPESVQGMIDDLRWLGLDWDEGPDLPGATTRYRQSDRLGFYREALERLIAADRLYPCTCTRADIARAASAPHAEDEGPRYPGTCAADGRPMPSPWPATISPGGSACRRNHWRGTICSRGLKPSTRPTSAVISRWPVP